MKVICHHARSGTTALQVVTAALDADERTAGMEVVFAKDASEVARAIETCEEDPLVLWSFYSPDFTWARAKLREVKASTRRGLHVAGGVHATAEPRETLDAGFDLAALGEGETTLVELCAARLEGRDERALQGLAHLSTRGELVSHGRGKRRELDAFPAFFERYGKWNAIEVTRGCVYACAFCQTPYVFKARFRHRSVASVSDAVAKMGGRYVRFLTPTSLSYGSDGTEPNLDAVEALLSGVRGACSSETKVYFGTFPSEVRPEHVMPRALDIIARYCDNRSLVIGGQSGSDAVLERLRRGHTVADVVRAVETCAEHGFRADVDFLFGLPGETDGERAETIALAKRLVAMGARIHSHAFMPLPGTPMRAETPEPIEGELLDTLHELEGKRAPSTVSGGASSSPRARWSTLVGRMADDRTDNGGHDEPPPSLRSIPASSERLVGSVVNGRYLVRREIGRGGICAVYGVEHRYTRRTYALKSLLPEYHKHQQARARLLAEARMLGAIHHANVVEVIDAGMDDGTPFLVMERLRAKSVEALLLARGKLTVHDALVIGRLAAEALAATHKARVIHRDIKPGNLLVVRTETSKTLKLIDFGVAVRDWQAEAPDDGPPRRGRRDAVLHGGRAPRGAPRDTRGRRVRVRRDPLRVPHRSRAVHRDLRASLRAGDDREAA